MNILNQYSDDSQSNFVETEPSSQNSSNSSERKIVGIKVGIREVVELLSTKDIFTVKGTRFRMERSKNGKDARESFLENAEKHGGDIHYFKVQTFGLTNPRSVF